MRPNLSTRLLLCVLSAVWVLCSLGCSRQVYPKSNYGHSGLSEARFSPDGFSVFRAICDDTDRRAIDIRSLSPKTAAKINSLVWTQHHFDTHSDAVLKWTEDWLSRGGKTFDLRRRDYSPMSEYWHLSALEKTRSKSDTKEIESFLTNQALRQRN